MHADNITSLPYYSIREFLDAGHTLAENGVFYGDDFAEILESSKYQRQLVRLTDASQSAQMVLKKKVKGMLDEAGTMTRFTAENPQYAILKQHNMFVHVDDVYIVASKKSVSKQTADLLQQLLGETE